MRYRFDLRFFWSLPRRLVDQEILELLSTFDRRNEPELSSTATCRFAFRTPTFGFDRPATEWGLLSVTGNPFTAAKQGSPGFPCIPLSFASPDRSVDCLTLPGKDSLQVLGPNYPPAIALEHNELDRRVHVEAARRRWEASIITFPPAHYVFTIQRISACRSRGYLFDFFST